LGNTVGKREFKGRAKAAVFSLGGWGVRVAGGDSSSLMAACEIVERRPFPSGYPIAASELSLGNLEGMAKAGE